MYKNYWQRHRLVSQIKQINNKKKFLIILEIKCGYLQRILILICYPKASS